MIRQTLRLAVHVSLSALMTLLAMTPARADVWTGSWDPQYGVPFTTPYVLGWGGKVKVNDDACTVPAGPVTITSSGCAFVVPGSLIVTLYQFPFTTPIYNTLSFTNLANVIVDQLRYDSNNRLTAFSTTPTSLSDFLPDSAFSPPNGAGTGADFAVNFVLDGGPCLFCGDLGLLPTNYDGPVLFAGSDPTCGEFEDEYCNFYRSNVAEFPARISFTPEPASLALIAGGLLAAGVGARRRRAARKEGQQ